MDKVVHISLPVGVIYGFIAFGISLLLYCYLITTTFLNKSYSNRAGTNTIDLINENTSIKEDDIKRSSVTQSKRTKYRIEEEGKKLTSSEYTRRGLLWSSHSSWHLPSAPRFDNNELETRGLEHILAILKKYDVDPMKGFLPSEDPLQRLPYARYHLWYYCYAYCNHSIYNKLF